MDAMAISSAPISVDSIKETWMQTFILSFQSLGVIYGRLSTAPLYVFETIDAGDISSPEEIHELFSFIFWTLTLIPLLKYSFIVLKADDDGEGGPFSLYSLLCRHAKVGLIPSNSGSSKMLYHEEDEISSSPSQGKPENKARKAIEKYKSCHYLLLFLALLGACMILSDAVLRPSISVLSATSGLGRSLAEISQVFYSDHRKDHVANVFQKYLPAPVACAILVGLFTLQHHGTKRIGCFFAPIIITWLLFISGSGLYNIIHYDAQILRAVSPVYMLRFLRKFNLRHGKLLSSTVLCIAGSEAMFADLGHFSKKSIKITFICFVYPVLLLTYAGQAAYISKNLHGDGAFHLSESIPNKDLEHIFAVLSLFASAVGSQATITAGFSIIHQCQALDCFPRVKVVHTSNKISGQVYVPDANWLFMVLSIAFTIGLHDTSKLAKATGLSVTTCLLVTTCLMSLVIALYWEKHLFASVYFLLFFGSVEAIYLTSTLTSFFHGAWCLFILFVFFITIMAAWHYGTLKKYESDVENKVSIEWLTDYSPSLGVSRVPGIGFVYSDVDTGIPAFFTHFISNIAAFHQVVVFVTFKASPVPYVHESRRYLIGRVGPKEYKMYRCIVRYGYHDNVRDTDDFEDDIIHSIGEFIVREEYDHEALNSPEGRMIVLGTLSNDGNVLITDTDMSSSECSSTVGVGESRRGLLDAPSSSGNRKRVRFMLPPESPKIRMSVSQELGEMLDARENGTTYFLGQSHLMARQGSNLFKRLLVMTYVFLGKNCREPPVALNIPNAALLEVGTVYKI
ncbi:potassium transporter 25-like [Salvia hispanica]|uniref:potassium transporter 25-like n=1 Tax=Salvia hispanica TaxID=49212 RepID=UPI00200981BC|nr:potassium transporter 25-like [Salvia hispanica]